MKHIIIAGTMAQAEHAATVLNLGHDEWQYVCASHQMWGKVLGPGGQPVHFAGTFWRNEAMDHFLVQRELYRQLKTENGVTNG